jgi:uncharacterized repeat protein (TIGR04076 family)
MSVKSSWLKKWMKNRRILLVVGGWNDIHTMVLALMAGGNFTQWMKEDNTYNACCTDGIKPVVFKLEKIDSQ